MYGATGTVMTVQLKTDVTLLAYEYAKVQHNPRDLERYITAGFSLLHAAVLSAPLWRGVLYVSLLSVAIDEDSSPDLQNEGNV